MDSREEMNALTYIFWGMIVGAYAIVLVVFTPSSCFHLLEQNYTENYVLNPISSSFCWHGENFFIVIKNEND
jgi:hypothetical protein